MEEILDKIRAYAENLKENLEIVGKNLSKTIIEHKNILIPSLLICLVLLVLIYTNQPTPTKPNVTREKETKLISYLPQNKDLIILVEYEWVDSVYGQEWDCARLNSPPRAKIKYTVKNEGEYFDELLYLPVPDYVYPNDFRSAPKFTWVNSLYLTIQDQPLEAGTTENYEFTVDFRAYEEVCEVKNEVEDYYNEVTRKLEDLETLEITGSEKEKAEQARNSLLSVKQEVENIVERMRLGGPAVSLASMDQISEYDLREKASLSRESVANTYSLHKMQEKINEVEDRASGIDENTKQLLKELSEQIEAVNDLREQIEEESQKPSLEDLLETYYNVSR